MPSPWVWSVAAHRYRNTRTGRFMGPTEMLGLRDSFMDAQRASAAELSERLVQGDLDVGQWQKMMRRDIKTSYIDQYVLAHGGRGTMTQADWGRIGAMVKEQYRYLDGFAEAVADGTLTEGQIRIRSQMYHDSSAQSYERGNAKAYGMPDLPAYPGDGSTACHTNCRCHWRIEEVEGGWDAYWVLDPAAEHCHDCDTRSGDWNPLEVRR